MGGKVLKPKIQAYVEQRWFDEFEVYRSSHNLNQSKALEKILAEFFSGSSKPATELDTAIAPTLIDGLRSELAEFKLGLEQRLQLVESRLAIESAAPLAKSARELVPSLNRLAAESAIYQANSANTLNKSALPLTGLATESAEELADELAITKAESATALHKLAIESAVIDSIVLDPNPVEYLAELNAELAKKSAVTIDEEKTDLADRLATVSAFVEATTALESAVAEDAIAPVKDVDIAGDRKTLGDADTPAIRTKKRGKVSPEKIKQVVEENLAFGQQLTAVELAEVIGGTDSGIRIRRKGGKLHEWGIQSVPESKPELFERISTIVEIDGALSDSPLSL